MDADRHQKNKPLKELFQIFETFNQKQKGEEK
jgi:hypothetical protein